MCKPFGDGEPGIFVSRVSGRGCPQLSGRGCPQLSGRGCPQLSGRGCPQLSGCIDVVVFVGCVSDTRD